MSRGWWLGVVALAGCLQPGSPIYPPMDSVAPTLVSASPALFDPDAAAVTLLSVQPIELTFSEELDPSSLRPGIAVVERDSQQELPLNISAPPLLGAAADRDSNFTVDITAPDGGYPSGDYSITLRSLLIDVQGNPLLELTGAFSVP